MCGADCDVELRRLQSGGFNGHNADTNGQLRVRVCMQEQERKLTLDLPMKMEKRVFRPSTSTKRSQAAGHRVHAKSCHHMSLSPYERQHLHNSKPLFTTMIN